MRKSRFTEEQKVAAFKEAEAGANVRELCRRLRVSRETLYSWKPVQNCFVESFNGTFRDDCLNLHWFSSLGAAKVQTESWRREYNTERPHSSLNRLTPVPSAAYSR